MQLEGALRSSNLIAIATSIFNHLRFDHRAQHPASLIATATSQQPPKPIEPSCRSATTTDDPLILPVIHHVSRKAITVHLSVRRRSALHALSSLTSANSDSGAVAGVSEVSLCDSDYTKTDCANTIFRSWSCTPIFLPCSLTSHLICD